jgi:hypothetical protein
MGGNHAIQVSLASAYQTWPGTRVEVQGGMRGHRDRADPQQQGQHEAVNALPSKHGENCTPGNARCLDRLAIRRAMRSAEPI